MAWRPLVGRLVVSSALLLCACDQPPRKVLPLADETKYALQKDAQGRTIRLDKATGETAVLTGDKLVVLKLSSERASSPNNAVPTTVPRPVAGAPRGSTAEDVAARYELQQDAQGQTVRLNVVTGEMAIVNGDKLIPVEPSTQRMSPESVVPATTAAAMPLRLAVSAAPAAPPPFEETISPSVDRHYVGARVVIATQSPVFVYPDENRTPLRLLAAGAATKLLGTEGDWYRIEFQDPRWGPRVGYVQKKGAAVDPESMRPADPSGQR